MGSAPVRREPPDRAAAQLRRGAVSGTPGSYRVVRARTDSTPPASSGGALSDLGYLRVDSGTANGSTLGGSLVTLKGSTVGTIDGASYSSSTGLFTVSRAGLWVLSAYLVVTNPVAGAGLFVNTPRVASAEASPQAWFHPDNFPGVGGAYTAATCSPPTPWAAGQTGYCSYYSGTSGAVINQFYLVFYPIAFFD